VIPRAAEARTPRSETAVFDYRLNLQNPMDAYRSELQP